MLHVARFTVEHVDALEDAVRELRVTGVEADYEVVDGIDAADTLIAEALRTDADLLALGTHGWQGIARVALGSVTTRVVRHATVPVLVASGAFRSAVGSTVDDESGGRGARLEPQLDVENEGAGR